MRFAGVGEPMRKIEFKPCRAAVEMGDELHFDDCSFFIEARFHINSIRQLRGTFDIERNWL